MQRVSRSNARCLCLVLTPHSIRNTCNGQRPHWITEFVLKNLSHRNGDSCVSRSFFWYESTAQVLASCQRRPYSVFLQPQTRLSNGCMSSFSSVSPCQTQILHRNWRGWVDVIFNKIQCIVSSPFHLVFIRRKLLHIIRYAIFTVYDNVSNIKQLETGHIL